MPDFRDTIHPLSSIFSSRPGSEQGPGRLAAAGVATLASNSSPRNRDTIARHSRDFTDPTNSTLELASLYRGQDSESQEPQEANIHTHNAFNQEEEESGEPVGMQRKSRSSRSADKGASSGGDGQGADDRRTREKGSANGKGSSSPRKSNGDSMQAPLEHRRKPYSSDDVALSPSSAASLVSREGFTLDDDPALSEKDSGSYGFFDLPLKDRRNFLVLVLLYFLQGMPLGLASGSVPFLLKSAKYGVSYSQIGIFSLASYPYSLKLLWSPIVDAIWSKRVGRRLSWILPVQVCSGIGLLWLGSRAERMMESAGANGGTGIWAFTGWWFFLVFGCATQDIAVDGWAITILSHKYLSYASTAQTVGLTAGSFLSFTVFLAMSDPHFANKWFRPVPPAGTEPLDVGLWTLGGYLTFAGWAYLAATLAIALFKREDKTDDHSGIVTVYKSMWGVLKLKPVQTIIIVHLIGKIGFQANDSVTNLKLLDKGFGQDNLSLTVLVDFPFELLLGYHVGKWSSTYPPTHIWSWAFIGRLCAAAFAHLVVYMFPTGGVTTGYLLLVIGMHLFTTAMYTIMFVAVAAFHAKIADPIIGGTYMTLLATVSNLGGTFPRLFVLKFVDAFTMATCSPGGGSLKQGFTAVEKEFSCAIEADRHRCIDGGGVCNVVMDGYYIVNAGCIVVGIATFVLYIRPKIYSLQKLPTAAWRVGDAIGDR